GCMVGGVGEVKPTKARQQRRHFGCWPNNDWDHRTFRAVGVAPNLGSPFHRRITRGDVVGRSDGNQAVSPGKLGTHPERYVAARRNLPVMDGNLMPRILEGPGDPMRLGAIGRIETDKELLSHRSALPSGIPGTLFF